MKRNIFIKSLFSAATLGCVGAHGASEISRASRVPVVVYFSWSGNTRSIARKIGDAVGADVLELTLENPYSKDYNTCLDEALRDQKKRARPKLKNPFDMGRYDTIFLGYPNWWGSIPMPVATFLESCGLDGKTIAPFCSHGGGRLGRSVSAIEELCPKSKLLIPLSVHYSGGASVGRDIGEWIAKNGLK